MQFLAKLTTKQGNSISGNDFNLKKGIATPTQKAHNDLDILELHQFSSTVLHSKKHHLHNSAHPQ